MSVYVMSIISSTSAVPAPRPPPDLPPLPGGLLLGSRPPQPGALLPAGRPPHRPGRRGPAARTLRIRGRSRKYFLALKYFCGKVTQNTSGDPDERGDGGDDVGHPAGGGEHPAGTGHRHRD